MLALHDLQVINNKQVGGWKFLLSELFSLIIPVFPVSFSKDYCLGFLASLCW